MKPGVGLPSLLLSGARHRRTPRCSQISPGSRSTHNDGRVKYSNFWIPSIVKGSVKDVDPNILLERAGFLRQAYSGIFHLLPLGLRVQDKLERLIDKHMRSLGASKVSLSSISSQALWERSGRLGTGSELFKFSDRKKARWLLSPTHEEEITSLVSSMTQSYRHLPIRVYQISRKYRDEKRPRQGLLRGREFLMKDLYTFDVDSQQAMITYEMVRQAYTNFFDELKIPYIVAKADSGNMGGNLSHEYHLPSSRGEDDIISCSSCDYTRNEELVEKVNTKSTPIKLHEIQEYTPSLDKKNLNEFCAVTNDRKTLVKAYVYSVFEDGKHTSFSRGLNPYIVKAAVPNVDLGIEDPEGRFQSELEKGKELERKGGVPFSVIYLFDYRVKKDDVWQTLRKDHSFLKTNELNVALIEDQAEAPIDLKRAESGDQCPACHQGHIIVQKAIEVGHTFHLGTRYSEKLDGTVTLNVGDQQQAPQQVAPQTALMQMGCHGIGVSRLIAAAASSLAGAKGLQWPRVIAPFQVVIISSSGDQLPPKHLYDKLVSNSAHVESSTSRNWEEYAIDAIIDDRPDKELLWKLRDADLIGYPVIVVFGKEWATGSGRVEIQCHQLGSRENVPIDDVPGTVKTLLAQL